MPEWPVRPLTAHSWSKSEAELPLLCNTGEGGEGTSPQRQCQHQRVMQRPAPPIACALAAQVHRQHTSMGMGEEGWWMYKGGGYTRRAALVDLEVVVSVPREFGKERRVEVLSPEGALCYSEEEWDTWMEVILISGWCCRAVRVSCVRVHARAAPARRRFWPGKQATPPAHAAGRRHSVGPLVSLLGVVTGVPAKLELVERVCGRGGRAGFPFVTGTVGLDPPFAGEEVAVQVEWRVVLEWQRARQGRGQRRGSPCGRLLLNDPAQHLHLTVRVRAGELLPVWHDEVPQDCTRLRGVAPSIGALPLLLLLQGGAPAAAAARSLLLLLWDTNEHSKAAPREQEFLMLVWLDTKDGDWSKSKAELLLLCNTGEGGKGTSPGAGTNTNVSHSILPLSSPAPSLCSLRTTTRVMHEVVAPGTWARVGVIRDGGTWAWRWLGLVWRMGLRGHFGEKEMCWRASVRQGCGLSDSEEAEEAAEKCGEQMRTERECQGGGAWPECRTWSNWSELDAHTHSSRSSYPSTHPTAPVACTLNAFTESFPKFSGTITLVPLKIPKRAVKVRPVCRAVDCVHRGPQLPSCGGRMWRAGHKSLSGGT
ncbi:hypothetical protein B0H14DRAFT_2620086 [Mycena olivaceomarginata]|nr:hypothetical protein B0H14DRAFT_2620086 [Mycena olivaceomarginata]